MNAVPRLRDAAGPALLSYGFRPFFLFGAIYAALTMLLWLPFYFGEITIATAFAPRDWHVHELLYGFLPAVITGFLLTAVPNWTGRLPLQGMPLLVLVGVWIAGWVAVSFSTVIGAAAAAVIDVSFLFLVAAAVAREIVAGHNWRNLKTLLPLILLASGNVAFHIEAYRQGNAEVSISIGVAAVIMLIMLIGGRVVPSFTHNWLTRENPGRLPLPFARFDNVAITVSATALTIWIALPGGTITGLALFTAGLLQAIRLARWAGDRTTRDRLVLILHGAYAFVPVGFLLTALAAFGIVPPSAGLHAWMTGAAGIMTLAIMTRTSLGHTGRRLEASAGTQVIFAAALFAAVARIVAALSPAWNVALLSMAALAWIAAFGGFAIVFGPLLSRARVRTKDSR